jgi:hypothetical protein
MGPISCTETSVQNYHLTLRNIPEERRSYPHLAQNAARVRTYRVIFIVKKATSDGTSLTAVVLNTPRRLMYVNVCIYIYIYMRIKFRGISVTTIKRRGAESSIPGRAERFLSFLQRPDRLCRQSSLPSRRLCRQSSLPSRPALQTIQPSVQTGSADNPAFRPDRLYRQSSLPPRPALQTIQSSVTLRNMGSFLAAKKAEACN